MKEKDIQDEIRLQIGKLFDNIRIFRNNCGVAFFGKCVNIKGIGTVLTKLRRVVYGLHVGSSDLIGWTTVSITKDMVGKRVAIFTSLEIKKPKKQPTEEQRNWLNVVKLSGGISCRIDNADDIGRFLNGPFGI